MFQLILRFPVGHFLLQHRSVVLGLVEEDLQVVHRALVLVAVVVVVLVSQQVEHPRFDQLDMPLHAPDRAKLCSCRHTLKRVKALIFCEHSVRVVRVVAVRLREVHVLPRQVDSVLLQLHAIKRIRGHLLLLDDPELAAFPEGGNREQAGGQPGSPSSVPGIAVWYEEGEAYLPVDDMRHDHLLVHHREHDEREREDSAVERQHEVPNVDEPDPAFLVLPGDLVELFSDQEQSVQKRCRLHDQRVEVEILQRWALERLDIERKNQTKDCDEPSNSHLVYHTPVSALGQRLSCCTANASDLGGSAVPDESKRSDDDELAHELVQLEPPAPGPIAFPCQGSSSGQDMLHPNTQKQFPENGKR
eukprot:3282652-Rhodomonas_salina.2